MNDRLGDLPAWAVDSDEEVESPANGKKGGDIEMGESTPTQPKHMEHFFREVESIKADIEAVQKATKKVGDINERALQATTTEEENVLSNQLRPLVNETNKRAKRTKTLLGLLKEENKKLEKTIKPSDLRYVERGHVSMTRVSYPFGVVTHRFLFQRPRKLVQHLDPQIH